MSKVHILFVCMGNICRSPTAHGIFQHLVNEAGLDEQVIVDSAGTIAYHSGNHPDPRATKTALEHGIDLTTQRARQVKADDYEIQDYILALDYDNLRDLQQQCPEHLQPKLHLLLHYHPDEYLDEVPDPYYGGDKGFEDVYAMVEIACKRLLEQIRQSI